MPQCSEQQEKLGKTALSFTNELVFMVSHQSARKGSQAIAALILRRVQRPHAARSYVQSRNIG